MSNHRGRAIMSWLTTNKNVNLIEGRHIVLDKWSNCWLTLEEEGGAKSDLWPEGKTRKLDGIIISTAYCTWNRNRFFSSIENDTFFPTVHEGSTRAPLMLIQSSSGLCRGFMISPNQMLEAHPWWRVLVGWLRFGCVFGCCTSALTPAGMS